MRTFVAAVGIATFAPLAAHAQGAADIQSLRDEIQQLRTQYEARIKALEAKLDAAQQVQAAPAPASAPAPSAAAKGGAASTGTGTGTGFNPAISLILSGTAARTSRDPAAYRIAGFPLPAGSEIGPGTRGFSLAESELGISANVDPWFSGTAAISLHPDDTVSVEEAYVQTTSLGNGLTVKAGRYFSSIGYLNSQHAHVWDFVDAPLAYQAMLGGQFADDGVQLAWVAPTDLLVEVRGELGRGRTYPGSSASRNGAGAGALSLHVGGDVGESSSWRTGVSVLDAKASNQQVLSFDPIAGSARTDAFSGSTRVWVADAVWKWAPNGNATRTNFKLQGEYLRSARDGSIATNADDVTLLRSGAYRQSASGWYLQAIYQFMRGWRVGARTERLDPGTPQASLGLPSFEAGWKPRKDSLMLDWSPSEFSRVRLQYARDLARPGAADNQWFLQYQMSLGAHGAHSF